MTITTENIAPSGNVLAKNVFIEHVVDLKDRNTLAVKRVFFEGIIPGTVSRSV